MPRRKMSSYQPQNTTMADDKKEVQNTMTSGAGTAKVTLVKPLQAEAPDAQDSAAEETATAKLSLARPKVGRSRSTISASQEDKEPAVSEVSPAIKEKQEEKTEKDILRDPMIATARPWDFKFILFLGALFVAVNLGLVILLHHDTPAKTSPARTAVIKANSAPFLTPPVAAAKVAPALAAAPAPASLPVSTPVPTVSLSVKPAPVVSASPAEPSAPQELLSIISKD
jgi:hypothetical protein